MKTCLTLLDTEADTEADVAFACQAHAQELHLAASGLKWFNGLTLIGLASLMSGSSVSKRQIRRKRPKPDRAWAAETRELHGTTWNYMETHGNTWKLMETTEFSATFSTCAEGIAVRAASRAIDDIDVSVVFRS